MADYLSTIFGNIKKRYRDMGDTSHAEVVASQIGRQYTVKLVTIANGQSLSGQIDLEGYALVGIYMPSAWTAADLTFQATDVSGGSFQNVYDDQGNEVRVTVSASCCIGIDAVAGALAPFRFMKIRSGTSAVPVAQGADRTIKLVLKG